MQYGIDVARDEGQHYQYTYQQGWVEFWATIAITAISFGTSELVVGLSDLVTANRASETIDAARALSQFSKVGPLFESASEEARATAILVRLGRSTATAILTAFFGAVATGDLNGQAVDSFERFVAGLIPYEGIQAIIEVGWTTQNDLMNRARVLASLNPFITNNTLNLYQARLLHAYNEFRREMLVGSGHQVIKPLGTIRQ